MPQRGLPNALGEPYASGAKRVQLPGLRFLTPVLGVSSKPSDHPWGTALGHGWRGVARALGAAAEIPHGLGFSSLQRHAPALRLGPWSACSLSPRSPPKGGARKPVSPALRRKGERDPSLHPGAGGGSPLMGKGGAFQALT